ncbi:MAG: hypothetical protein KAI71_00310 [Candidatus Pacebacteria bacterium]|nr:hypothetical protein [Candidatus Paceibacterota bacterium]
MAIDTKTQQRLEFLKKTDSRSTADNRAYIIREAVKTGETSWKKLGVTDDDITRFVLEAYNRNAQWKLKDLKKVDSGSTAKDRVRDIKRIIKTGATSWKKLGVTDDDITRFVLEAYNRNAQWKLRDLKKTNNILTADSRAEDIRKIVKIKAISWKELGVTDDDITKLVLEAHGRNAQEELEDLKRIDSGLAADSRAKDIRNAVKEGTINWKELGVTDDDITKLVLEAQEREKKK